MPTHPSRDFPFAVPGEALPTGVEFVAYTKTAMINARFELAADRLSDALNSGEQFRLRNVTRTTLESMSSQSFDELDISRDELLVVYATGPRGNPRLRYRASRHPVSLAMGPYHVQGWIHTALGAHPTLGVYHRQVMVPLTEAEVSYIFLGRQIMLNVDAVIVNREAAASIGAVNQTIADHVLAAFPYTSLASPEPDDDGSDPEGASGAANEAPAPAHRILQPPREPTRALFYVGSRTPPYLARPPRRQVR